MSSPIFEIPEHMLIPVNADGEGPITDELDVDHWACWCGNDDCPGSVEDFHSGDRHGKVNTTNLYTTTDASVWAAEFAKVCPDVDEGLMVGWFANAIETAKSLTLQDNPDRAVRHDLDYLVLPNDAFLQFMGEVALPPYGPDGDVGTDLDCAPIVSKIIDWLDQHDLSDLYFRTSPSA